MKARHMAMALALTLGAQPLLAENARHRDGSPSGGHGDRGRAESTYRPYSGGSTSFSGGGRATSHSGSGRSQPLTDAQRRHPRPGSGTLYYGQTRHYPYSRSYGYYRPYGYYPYYRPYWGFYYGYWSPYPYYGDYYGGSYGYPYYSPHAGSGAIRVLVDPNKARVYVDGYYAGVADDFDGIFQRLYVSPGRHEIALKLDGYRTHRVRIYVARDATLKLRYDMVRGEGEDTFEDLAGDAERYEPRDSRARRDDAPGYDMRGEPGRLRLDIRPEDASVYVDGRFWGTGRGGAELELPSGRHRVEIVRPGFRTEERDVEIEPGRTERLEVELGRP